MIENELTTALWDFLLGKTNKNPFEIIYENLPQVPMPKVLNLKNKSIKKSTSN